MSATGVGIRVTLDGREVDAGAWVTPPVDALSGMTAEEGLSIVWGRKSVIEQPSPSTCAFRLWDEPGGASYADTVRVGSRVAVWAEGTVPSGGAGSPTFADPGFETEVRATTTNATVTRTNRAARVKAGTYAAKLHPVTMGAPWAAAFPPAALQAPGTNPGAWDGLPKVGAGQTWRLGMQLWVPEAVTVKVRPVIYTGPYAASGTVQTAVGTVTGPAGGGWVSVDQPYYPGSAAGWLGFALEVSGGLSWADLPPSLTWATEPSTILWEDYSDVFVDSVSILAPAAGSPISILVFGGRVTDIEAAWDDTAQGAGVGITAVDFLGDLGNRYVGDSPWAAETLGTRFTRVLSLAAAAGEPPTTADIASTLSPVVMTAEDVDHRAASGLLSDMANSVDGVLWSATHAVTGPYVKLEDPYQRPALYRLRLIGGVIKVVLIDPATLPPEQRPTALSACDVLRDPVTFLRDVTDIATRARVTWQEQTLPNPTERTFSVVSAPRELSYGTRAVGLSSMLTTAADAERVADRLMARQSGNWRVDGLAVGDADFRIPDDAAATILLGLLDGVRRGGLPLLITDMPDWAPLGSQVPVYLEGGSYAFVGGGWQLALSVSVATGLGATAAWDELDATWKWDQWDPTLTWDALRGVGKPPTYSAWSTQRTNWFNNPTVDGTYAATGIGGGVPSRTTAEAHRGAYSYQCVCPGVALYEGIVFIGNSFPAPVTGTYAAGAWVKAPAGSRFYAFTRAIGGTSTGDSPSVFYTGTGAWQWVSSATTSGTGNTSIQFQVRTTVSIQAMTFYTDDILLEVRTTAPVAADYFDGSTAPTPPSDLTQTVWAAAANGSVSYFQTRTIVS